MHKVPSFKRTKEVAFHCDALKSIDLFEESIPLETQIKQPLFTPTHLKKDEKPIFSPSRLITLDANCRVSEVDFLGAFEGFHSSRSKKT